MIDARPTLVAASALGIKADEWPDVIYIVINGEPEALYRWSSEAEVDDGMPFITYVSDKVRRYQVFLEK